MNWLRREMRPRRVHELHALRALLKYYNHAKPCFAIHARRAIHEILFQFTQTQFAMHCHYTFEFWYLR